MQIAMSFPPKREDTAVAVMSQDCIVVMTSQQTNEAKRHAASAAMSTKLDVTADVTS